MVVMMMMIEVSKYSAHLYVATEEFSVRLLHHRLLTGVEARCRGIQESPVEGSSDRMSGGAFDVITAADVVVVIPEVAVAIQVG